MLKIKSAVVLAIAMSQIACANYGTVATVNQENLDALERMKTQFDKKSTAAIYDVAKSNSGLVSLAGFQVTASKAELASNFGDPDCKRPCASALNYRIAMIDQALLADEDAALKKAGDLERLQDEFTKSFGALEKNGEEIQEYLELNWFQRLYRDAKGMDGEELKKIGEDMKSIAERVGADS